MRKKRIKGGDQHAISARIDGIVWEWLKDQPNKNRLINNGLEFIRQLRRFDRMTHILVDNTVVVKLGNELEFFKEEEKAE